MKEATVRDEDKGGSEGRKRTEKGKGERERWRVK